MGDSITKKDLLHRLSERVKDEVPPGHVTLVLDRLVDLVVELTAAGEKIHLNDFGKFEVIETKPRSGKATFLPGQPTHAIPAGWKLKFTSFARANRRIALLRQPPQKRRRHATDVVGELFGVDDDE